ncbi:MAG: EAL domain-containing protein [Burkholderiales bacterium]
MTASFAHRSTSSLSDLGTSADAGAIAIAIIAMANALDKQVVAEGVETKNQAALLTRMQYDHIQGITTVDR